MAFVTRWRFTRWKATREIPESCDWADASHTVFPAPSVDSTAHGAYACAASDNVPEPDLITSVDMTQGPTYTTRYFAKFKQQGRDLKC